MLSEDRCTRLLSALMCMLWWGLGGWGPHLVLLCCFFQDKAKGPLLAGRPLPPFSPWLFPRDHREVWSPDSPAQLLCAQSLGPPQKCHLSEHALPCRE